MTNDELKQIFKIFLISAIFYPSDLSENYSDKKTYIKKAFWLKPQPRASMHGLQI